MPEASFAIFAKCWSFFFQLFRGNPGKKGSLSTLTEQSGKQVLGKMVLLRLAFHLTGCNVHYKTASKGSKGKKKGVGRGKGSVKDLWDKVCAKLEDLAICVSLSSCTAPCTVIDKRIGTGHKGPPIV